MAKNTTDKSPEALEKEKREKEWKEREKAEQKELDKKKAEKKKKEAEKQKRIKVREQKELKRIKEKIYFPFKLLFNISFLLTLISFIVLFYGWDITIFDAVFYTFFIFLALYVGLGLLMVGFFYVVSEEKIKLAEEKAQEDEVKRLDEERKLAEKHAQLEENLREEYLKQQNYAFDSSKTHGLNKENDSQSEIESDYEEGDYFSNSGTQGLFNADLTKNPFVEDEDIEGGFDDSEFANDESLVDEDFINSILSGEEQRELEINDKKIRNSLDNSGFKDLTD